MKSKPVRKYAQPKYPTRLEIAARPDLLQRHQPPTWRKWPELTGAAGLFLLADTARLSAAHNSLECSKNPAQTNAVAIVAPIFRHGEGFGATGCIVMSPPVLLSEEEALQVIREEMATILDAPPDGPATRFGDSGGLARIIHDVRRKDAARALISEGNSHFGWGGMPTTVCRSQL